MCNVSKVLPWHYVRGVYHSGVCKSGIALKQISLVDLFYVIDVGTLSWVRAGVVTVVFYRAFNCLILACFSCVELLLWLLSRWWSLLFRPIDHRLQSPWMAKGSGWRWRVSKVPWLWYVRRNQRSRDSSRSCSQRTDFQNTNHRADICSCNWPLW